MVAAVVLDPEPMTGDALEGRVLLAYNVWANRRVLDAASALPGLLCERDLGTSYGSVGGTLRHIAWGEWLWLGRWQQTAPTQLRRWCDTS